MGFKMFELQLEEKSSRNFIQSHKETGKNITESYWQRTGKRQVGKRKLKVTIWRLRT